MALGASVLTLLALAAVASVQGGDPTNPADTAAFSAADRGERADRSDRQSVGDAAGNALGAVNDVLDPAGAQAQKDLAAWEAQHVAGWEAKHRLAAWEAQHLAAWEAQHGTPIPVAGLNQTQMDNAKHIVDAGKAMGLSKRAYVIAVATSMQECNLYNLASTVLPDSYNYPSDGSGSDHDSIGLFQQRPSTGWGSIAAIMDPGYAATAFYKVLVTVPGWDSMALTYAAQRVQVSAFPEAYAKHEARAQQVVDGLT